MRLKCLGTLFLVCFFISSCSVPSNNFRTRVGNNVSEEKYQKLQINKSSKPEIEKMLGSPNFTSTLDEKTWYYLYENRSKLLFFPYKILNRNLVELKFNKKGILVQKNRKTLKDGQKIAYQKRETPIFSKERNTIMDGVAISPF